MLRCSDFAPCMQINAMVAQQRPKRFGLDQRHVGTEACDRAGLGQRLLRSPCGFGDMDRF